MKKTREDLYEIFYDKDLFRSAKVFIVKSFLWKFSWDLSKKINKFLIETDMSWRSSLNIFLRSFYSEDIQWRSTWYLQKRYDNISSKDFELGNIVLDSV